MSSSANLPAPGPPTTSARKARKSRGRGLRTTTGCKICRVRHMKCDEVKPICGQCVKSHRACEYDEVPVSTEANFVSPNAQQGRRRALSNPDSDAHPRRGSSKASSQAEGPRPDKAAASRRWLGLLPVDTADVDLEVPSQCSTNGKSCAGSPPERPNVMQVSTIASSKDEDQTQERSSWQASERIPLEGLEFDMLSYFVNSISVWIDIFDPLRHFATLIPRLALFNQGLLKAVLALGAKVLTAKCGANSGDAAMFQNAAVHYYAESLNYLQSAMKYASYKNSQEVLATTLCIAAYEMMDGGGKGWERHLKGVFWIQRTREINGESGGLEQAVWWAWLHQDLWAAFRERRRCFSFFKPTEGLAQMSMWDVAARIVYILAQCVSFASDEEQRNGHREPANRIARATELEQMLAEWNEHKGVAFDPLPLAEPGRSLFQPLWIHPPAFAIATQMFHVARILLLAHRPATERHAHGELKEAISESVQTVAGLAEHSAQGALGPLSMQYLFMAGLYCSQPEQRRAILDILEAHTPSSNWPSSLGSSDELRAAWTTR